MSTLEFERKFIEELIADSGLSLREVSISIGKKESYLHQYVKYGSPKRLSAEDWRLIAMIIKKDGKFCVDGDVLSQKRLWDAERRLEKIISNTLFNHPYVEARPCKPTPKKSDVVEINIYNQDSKNRNEVVGHIDIKCEALPFSCSRVYHGLIVTSHNIEPAIYAGDLVIYDYVVSQYAGDGIYVCIEDDLRVLKHVVKDEDGSLLLKDNNSEVKVGADYGFYGRVVSVLKSQFEML